MLLDVISVETLGFDTKTLYSIIVLITALCSLQRVHYKVVIQSDSCLSYFRCYIVHVVKSLNCYTNHCTYIKFIKFTH